MWASSPVTASLPLSIVYPVQLIVTAIAVGTGVGVNTLMSRYDGQGEPPPSRPDRRNRTVLALISWLIFAVLSGLLMRPFAAISTESLLRGGPLP